MSGEFWTYEGRVASFKPKAARRASTAKGIKATKATKWPHQFLSPERLADAGFYYNPSAKETDNVTCFLCDKSIVGWEEDDDPIAEHLKLSSDCGWAIIASIQAKNEELLMENPIGPRLTDARRATFADRWPHETKDGWKCKTSQLVEAGWTFQPTPEYDDLTSCVYCELSLDGWEQEDDPMEQHQKRNPECTFFALVEELPKPAPKKKAAKGRKPRASKASRISTQSTLADTSELPSYMDQTAMEDDSVLTTATVATNTGAKKPNKAPATKRAPRATRASKASRLSSVVDAKDDHVDDVDLDTENSTPRMDDSVLTVTSNVHDTTVSRAASTRKRAAPKAAVNKKSKSVELEAEDVESQIPVERTPKEAPEPEDDDFEVKIPVKPKSTRGKKRGSDQVESSTLMIDEEPTTKRRAVRATKASTANTAKTTRGRKQDVNGVDEDSITTDQASESIPQSVRHMFDTEPMEIDDNELDAELEAMAQSTPRAKDPMLRLSEIITVEDEFETAMDFEESVEKGVNIANEAESAVFIDAEERNMAEQSESNATLPFVSDTISKNTQSASSREDSPQSVQSSDAENRPPPYQPSTTQSSNTPKRIPIAVSTPQVSPSKRNIISNLQSTLAWDAVNLDTILLQSPATMQVFDDVIDRAKQGILTDEEAKMTVEAWIRHNAATSENKLKAECERMVSTFEREGLKALRVLESIQCID